MTIRKVSYKQGSLAAPYKLPAEDHRLNHAMLWTPDTAAGGLRVRSGIVPGPGNPGAVTVTAGGVNINPFHAVIQGSLSSTQGPYELTSDAVEFRAITAASSTEFRRGVVIARVYDQLNPGSGPVTDVDAIEVVYGANAATAGAAPAPVVPANSLILREFAVSNTGAITLVGSPAYTAPRAGVLTLATEAERTALPVAALYDGLRVKVTATRRQYEWDAAAPIPAGGTGRWLFVGGPAPHVKVRRVGTWTSGTSGWQAFPWTQRINTGTAADDVTDTSMWAVGQPSRLVAPIDGLYLAEASIGYPSGQPGYLGLLRNGEGGTAILRKASTPAVAGDHELAGSVPIRLAAGQYVETVIYSATAVVFPGFPTEQQPGASLTWIGNY